MKVKILKKSIKEGVSLSTGKEYAIKSLFVNFEDAQIYENIKKHLKAQGAAEDMIDKFIKPNEYNGKTSFSFGLNCTNYTFDNVEQFGILDAKIQFKVQDNGFITAKIMIENNREMVMEYEKPATIKVDGWAENAVVKSQVVEPAEMPADLPAPDLSGLTDLSNLAPIHEEGKDYSNNLPF